MHMRRLTAGLLAGAFGALAFTVALGAAAGTVPEAAMTGDVATVKSAQERRRRTRRSATASPACTGRPVRATKNWPPRSSWPAPT
jgi:hypothetical protein